MDSPLDDHQQAAIEALFTLLNFHDAPLAAHQLARFEEAMADSDAEDFDGEALLDMLREVIDWECGFYVDWKDAASFIGCVSRLCERIDLELDWGTDDPEDIHFLAGTTVTELMQLAHDQLRVAGYTLWNWDTGGDAYAGWMTLSEDDETLLDIAQTLDLEIRPADRPY